MFLGTNQTVRTDGRCFSLQLTGHISILYQSRVEISRTRPLTVNVVQVLCVVSKHSFGR
jgi:hypothetical protein